MKTQEVKSDTITTLVGEIEYLNEEYRKGNSLVSDREYDQKLEELRKLDPNNRLFNKGVIESTPTSRKVKLPIPMYSLNKAKSIAEIKAWVKGKGLGGETLLVITPKLNGISFVADAPNKLAATRGDGEYGQSSWDHYAELSIQSSDMLLEESKEIIFGEMIIPRLKWDEHFAGKVSPKGLPYKLNHATVAGLFNNDEPEQGLKHVRFVKYGIFGNGSENEDKVIQIEMLRSRSMHCVEMFLTSAEHLTEELCDTLYNTWNSQYPVDGLVIDINSAELRASLGREANMNPAYARALKLDKWSGEQETTIIGHDFEISKQGKLKGVVKFDTLYFEGSEVNQATFYNANFLMTYMLYKGVKISVKKSGDIIPKIVRVEGVLLPIRDQYKNDKLYKEAILETAKKIVDIELSKGITPAILEYCPYCNNPLNWDDTKTELICDNHSGCRGIAISKLDHFFTTAGIEEFGRPSIIALYDAGYTTIKDILSISRKQLASIPGFGNASADVILDQFEKLLNPGISIAKLAHALDVFEGMLGEKTVQLILDSLPEQFPDFKMESVVAIKGVGEITATQFLIGFEAFREELFFIDYLISINQITTPKTAVIGSKYANMSVCFSGVRDKALEDEITAQGGKIASGVSKTTTHLIVADVTQGTSKTVKARELNIPILTIEHFKTNF